MPRPIRLCVSCRHLAHNLARVRSRVDSARIWAVIKANAYGHGIERAVSAFARADGLAMLDLQEAIRCREAGWAGPILLLEGFFEPADLELLQQYRLTTALHSSEQLRMLEMASLQRPLSAFLKMNSGMNRLGFQPEVYRAAFERAQALKASGRLGEVGRMTHFATADGPEGIDWQLERFTAAAGDLPGPLSLANSAASWRYAHARADWVRPGIVLYGSSPFADESAESMGLRPGQTLRTEVIGIQHLKPGETVGYGATFKAESPMRLGIIACGYADGYPRHAPTGTPVVVAGKRTRLVGRVSMDMITVDLGPVPDAAVGAPVVLWGEGGPSIDEVASAAGTIGYELMCAVAPRVPVQLVD
jgi:alanine racemase